MAELPVVSLQNGGFLWFQDLSIADPYYILPVLSAATFWITVEVRFSFFIFILFF